MSELIRRKDAINAVETFFKDAHIEDSDVHCTDMVYEINHIPTACVSCFRAGSCSQWHRVEDGLPERNDAVNVVWVNRNPESYYADIKDKPFVATAHYHNGKWYWFSATCKDFLDEYGRCEVDEVDKDIDILYWMPLPSPPVNKMFTK